MPFFRIAVRQAIWIWRLSKWRYVLPMHHAGAVALGELLNFDAPPAERRMIPCSCGHQARYQELRSKPVLTAVGPARVSRPYYLCSHCHSGQFPADVELDIEDTELSPGVRRMQAVVGRRLRLIRGGSKSNCLPVWR